MKRILFISFLCFATFCISHAENNDEHLKQLVQCINDSDFVCATEQLPLVENWTFDWYGADSLAIDKALLFAKYAEAKHITKPTIDSLKMYAEQACYRIRLKEEISRQELEGDSVAIAPTEEAYRQKCDELVYGIIQDYQ